MLSRFAQFSLRRTSRGSFQTRLLCTAAENNIQVENISSGIYCLSLCREKGKNSFSKQMVEDVRTALSDLHANEKVNVLIVRSTVEKVFCAGADLKERAGMADADVGAFVAQLRNTFTSISRLPFPTIAAIEGVALGGGLELALACDLRIAGSKALLGLPETALAIIPGAGGTQRLSRVVGVAKAKELIFTGARLGHVQSAEIGLVTEAVEAGMAFDRAVELARIIDEKGPIALRAAKEAIDMGSEVNIEQGLEIEKACYDKVIYTADRKEGLKAFVEKRKPAYIGK